MTSLVFLNLLAYAGIGFVAASLIYLGSLLLRPNSATRGLATMFGENRACQSVRGGYMNSVNVRAIGVIFILLGGFIAFCIARDLRHV